ncbi:uncharacterized protein LOC104887000 [Beta vulgaris subsp. vulgaris]|uniref:uncharacterized protein LOC104887000 n=1 Tax=Beta vulgaris subsp. vulgaris TaxID=3555 RepID=UPI0005402AD6|nr:uncharacterized protein LOC104887000 [Beta vulgaris subsp. vulgaris]
MANMQKFSIQECYRKLIGESEKVNWRNFVWNRLTLPEHRFICWLVMKERLNIALRLRRMGIIADPLCRLCGLLDETHIHLFFNCPFSLAMSQSISNWMQFDMFGVSIESSIRKIITSRRSRFQKQVLLAVLGATIYFIWLARNDVWNCKVC